MRYAHILQAIYCEPWLIKPAHHAALRKLVDDKLQSHLSAVIEHAQAARPKKSFFGEPLPQMEIDPFGVAIIPVRGVMGLGMSAFEKSCGAVGTEDVQADVETALADRSVRGLFLDMNTPGGMVAGIPELADRVAEATAVKPVYAYADNLIASAGYFTAAGATKIIGGKSSELGYIETYMPWIDSSMAFAEQGLKVEIIKNDGGDFVAAGYPGTSLTAEQRNQLQSQVDHLFGMYVDHVETHRPIKRADMRGQGFYGAQAVAHGFLDAVMSRTAALEELRRLVG